jgi:hypothetical protein
MTGELPPSPPPDREIAWPNAERLVLLPNHAMRARRCVRPIVALWAWEALLGALLAWPFASIVRGAYGSHPREDAVLWDPGGLSLLDLLVRKLPVVGSLVAHFAGVTLVALVLSPWPSAVLLVCLGFATRDKKTPGFRRSMPLAVGAFGPFALLLVLTLVLQSSLLAAAATAAGLADQGFSPKYGEVAAEVIALAILGAGLALVALAGVVQDAARAAVVRFNAGAGWGLRSGLAAVGHAPLSLFWSWAWRAGASWVPVAFGALLAGRVGGRGGAALVALLVIHQLVIGVRVALRASWLARVMRAVDRT